LPDVINPAETTQELNTTTRTAVKQVHFFPASFDYNKREIMYKVT